jgi:hypothetical protein
MLKNVGISLLFFSGIFLGVFLFLPFQIHAEPQNAACGISGSLSARIENCNTKRQALLLEEKYSWSLVMQNNPQTSRRNIAVWIDDTTQLVWGDQFRDDLWGSVFSFKEARTLCENSKYNLFGGSLEKIKWRLPKQEDYLLAEAHGVRKILPHLFPEAYWTSSPEEVEDVLFSRTGWLFSGLEGKTIPVYKSSHYSVRCVSNPLTE